MRLRRGGLLSAACGLSLLVEMFAFAWYGVDGIAGRASLTGAARTENGWEGLPLLRWLMLITILMALCAPLLDLRLPLGSRTLPTRLMLAVGALTAMLLVYRVLIDPPSPTTVPDQKLGAVLGVLSALGILVGAIDGLGGERAGVAVGRRSR